MIWLHVQEVDVEADLKKKLWDLLSVYEYGTFHRERAVDLSLQVDQVCPTCQTNECIWFYLAFNQFSAISQLYFMDMARNSFHVYSAASLRYQAHLPQYNTPLGHAIKTQE